MWEKVFGKRSERTPKDSSSVELELTSLSDEIEEGADDIDTDLERFQRMVHLIQESQQAAESVRGDFRYLSIGPFMNLLNRILDDQKDSPPGQSAADWRLQKIRAFNRSIYPVLTDLWIFMSERMMAWPAHSRFEGQSGLAGQALDFAHDRHSFVSEDGGGDLDEYFAQSDKDSEIQKMGSTIQHIILDCEAVASRADLPEIGDEHLFAYLAAIAAAEDVISRKYDSAVWSELNDGVHIAAGSARYELIAQFISELCVEVGNDFSEQFADMQKPYYEHIESKVADSGDPCDFYKRCIQAADDFWAQTVLYEKNQFSDKSESEDLTDSDEATAEIEKRLDHLESLRRKGVLSEVEYWKLRNRILDDI